MQGRNGTRVEQQRVHTARYYIEISFDSLLCSSSDELLEKSSDDSFDSVKKGKTKQALEILH